MPNTNTVKNSNAQRLNNDKGKQRGMSAEWSKCIELSHTSYVVEARLMSVGVCTPTAVNMTD